MKYYLENAGEDAKTELSTTKEVHKSSSRGILRHTYVPIVDRDWLQIRQNLSKRNLILTTPLWSF